METKPDARLRRNELGRGDRTWPYKDRTRPISCSATAGVSSYDRTMSKAVTGHTDDTILRHGNVFSVTECSGTGRPDAQSIASDRVQRGSRAALERPNASYRVRPDLAQGPINVCALTVRTTGHVRSGQQQRSVSGRKLGFTPNGYFLGGAYK